MKLTVYSLLTFLQFVQSGLYAQDTRSWATYYGGMGNDGGFALTSDPSGNVYMAGITMSANGIASGGFQNTFGGGVVDAYLVKFDSAGNRLWATYYGGNGDEMAFFGGKLGIATDGAGNVFLAGFTSSTNNIAAGGFQNAPGGSAVNAYLVKFDPAGNRLWGTYYGGISADKAYSVTADEAGNVYIAGIGSSSGLAANGFQNTLGGLSDALLVKFDASGNRVWATYYGGPGTEEGYSVVTDNSLNVYLAGITNSTTAIASGGAQNSFGGGSNDLFVVKFDSGGSRLWATYYGGNADEMFLFNGDMDLATDLSGNVYLTGLTSSSTNIYFNGFQSTLGGGSSDAFLAKFDAAGNRLWATYYGGSDEDKGYHVAVDLSGNVYMAGRTDSPNAIASGGFQNTQPGPHDAFLALFDPAGSRICATYFGGTDVDECNAVAVGDDGYVYLAGNTTNLTGIAWNGFQNLHGGGTSDAFLVKFTECFNTTAAEELLVNGNLTLFPNPVNTDYTVVLPDAPEGLDAGISVYNAIGTRVVYTGVKMEKNVTMNVQDLPPGVYTVTLHSESVQRIGRFIKQ